MTLSDIARWVVAGGFFMLCLSGLLSPRLPVRNAIALAAASTVGAILCLSHLAGGEVRGVAMIDGAMLALVSLGCGALFGHAFRRCFVNGERTA